jgi:predicted RNase H-like HicB family nuclease
MRAAGSLNTRVPRIWRGQQRLESLQSAAPYLPTERLSMMAPNDLACFRQGVARAIAKQARWVVDWRFSMTRYVALVDGKPGSYGPTVPDLPGCTSAAATTDEVLRRATEAVRLWAEDALADGEETTQAALDRGTARRSRSGGGACKGRRSRDRAARPRCGPAGQGKPLARRRLARSNRPGSRRSESRGWEMAAGRSSPIFAPMNAISPRFQFSRAQRSPKRPSV